MSLYHLENEESLNHLEGGFSPAENHITLASKSSGQNGAGQVSQWTNPLDFVSKTHFLNTEKNFNLEIFNVDMV